MIQASRCSLPFTLVLLAGCASPSRPPTPPTARPPTAAAAPHSTMLVHFIDVGQGAATLFEFADGAVLVDTGGEVNSFRHSDAVLPAYLPALFAPATALPRHR